MLKVCIKLLMASILFFTLGLSTGQAADNWYELSVANAMNSPLAQEKIHPNIQVFMMGQDHPVVARKIGEYKSNKRGNAFGRSKEQACEAAFLSAIIALQERAINEGGNAVIDIYSMTKYRRYENPENFNCLSGNVIANVVLMGTVVKLQ